MCCEKERRGIAIAHSLHFLYERIHPVLDPDMGISHCLLFIANGSFFISRLYMTRADGTYHYGTNVLERTHAYLDILVIRLFTTTLTFLSYFTEFLFLSLFCNLKSNEHYTNNSHFSAWNGKYIKILVEIFFLIVRLAIINQLSVIIKSTQHIWTQYDDISDQI